MLGVSCERSLTINVSPPSIYPAFGSLKLRILMPLDVRGDFTIYQLEKKIWKVEGFDVKIKHLNNKTAKERGCQLLTNLNLRARIDEALAERSRRTGVNADRIVRELAKVAFLNATDVVDTNTAKVLANASEDDKAAIASVKVKISSGESSDSVEREIKFTCIIYERRLFNMLKAYLNLLNVSSSY